MLAAFLAAVTENPRTYRVVLGRPEIAPMVLQKLVNRRRADLAQRLRPLVRWSLANVDAPTQDIDVDVRARMLLSTGEELGRMVLEDPDFPPSRIARGAWGLLDAVPVG